MQHRVTVALLSTALALSSFSCSREEHANAAPSASAPLAAGSTAKVPTLEPCRLLTADEASVFLDGSAVATPSEKVAYASSCIWEAQPPRRGLQVMTSTPAQLRADEELRKIEGHTIEKRFAQLLQAQIPGDKGTPIGGLGDAALWAKQAGQLWIMKRNQALITISFHSEQGVGDDALTKCKAVGEKVLARL